MHGAAAMGDLVHRYFLVQPATIRVDCSRAFIPPSLTAGTRKLTSNFQWRYGAPTHPINVCFLRVHAKIYTAFSPVAPHGQRGVGMEGVPNAAPSAS